MWGLSRQLSYQGIPKGNNDKLDNDNLKGLESHAYVRQEHFLCTTSEGLDCNCPSADCKSGFLGFLARISDVKIWRRVRPSLPIGQALEGCCGSYSGPGATMWCSSALLSGLANGISLAGCRVGDLGHQDSGVETS